MKCANLALGSDSDVSVDRCIWTQVDGLLNAHVCQSILTKYGAGIQISSHEATYTRQGLIQCK